MKIATVITGCLEENCYIISNNNECLIVDPGDEYNKIIKNIGDLKVIGILITHYHFDHIGALEEIKNKYKVNIYDYKDVGKNISISNFNFKVIDTKGHTIDSTSFYFEKDKIMFTGDFLFKESIGRCDFAESDYNLMQESIKRIKTYDKKITIYPGHGSITTLEYEFNNNIYLN